jgi:endonuclease-8
MPEGDTILTTARTLARALGGQVVERVETRVSELAGVRELTGQRIDRIETRGKNLLIVFDDGRVLYTHLRMHGSWHLYRPGETWRKPARRARVVLHTDRFVAVCFNAPVVEVLEERRLAAHRTIGALGPDLLAPEADLDALALRLAAHGGDRPIGELLMRQRTVAGIGNVYKSEVLFLCGVDPFARTDALERVTLRRLLSTARELMQKNLGGQPRRTRFALDEGRFWVYGRSGKPCRRCGTPIALRRQGLDGRTTYYCPACQAVASRPPGQNVRER